MEVLPALLVSGGAFATMQFYWSNYQRHDPGLVDIVAAIFSLLMTVAFLRFWKPRHLMEDGEGERTIELRHHSVGTILKGWSPFALASVFIFLWALPEFSKYLRIPFLTVPTPWLHNAVIRTPPVTPIPTPEAASIDFNFFGLPGTAVFLGAFLAALLLGMDVGRALRLLGRTLRQLVPSMLAISFMVGLAYVTRYSGMDTVMGLSLTRTGWIYPFFGTLLGWLGVALTGTDAGSNALFGNLQKVTAEQLGIPPVLMASANSAGGVMGKMIDAQSIVVASTACRLEGREADVWKAVFWHSLTLASLVGLVVMFYAYVARWAIPGVERGQPRTLWPSSSLGDRGSRRPMRASFIWLTGSGRGTYKWILPPFAQEYCHARRVFTEASVPPGGSRRRSHAGQPAGVGPAAAGAGTRPKTGPESRLRGTPRPVSRPPDALDRLARPRRRPAQERLRGPAGDRRADPAEAQAEEMTSSSSRTT